MKILAEETVTRYHIEFDEEETVLLRRIGLLPPHAEACACLWATAAEVETARTMLARAKGPVE